MLCQRCHKNEASIHVVKMVNGNKSDSWICEECAKELSKNPLEAINLDNKKEPSIESIIGSFMGMLDDKTNPNNIDKIDVVCKKCGTTLSKFKITGTVGCLECYDSFREEIKKYLQKEKQYSVHIGKIPNGVKDKFTEKKKMIELKAKLKSYIEQEEYEKAAVIRDKILKLEEAEIKEENYGKLE